MKAKDYGSLHMKALATIVLILGMSPLGWSSITLGPPTGANYVQQVDCPHPIPGWTRLDSLVLDSAETLAALNADVMMNSRVNNQFAGQWAFQMNLGLTGTLNVSTYKAHDDPGACQHGAEIRMSLDDVSGLPANQVFQWIQVYTETGNSGNGANIVDPPSGQVIPILDGNGNQTGTLVSDTLPFYSDSTANSTFSFFDRPSDLLPDTSPHNGGVSFMTYLTSWDGAFSAGQTETVNIYGALEWGYTYQCLVPEPSAASLAALALLVLCTERHLRRR